MGQQPSHLGIAVQEGESAGQTRSHSRTRLSRLIPNPFLALQHRRLLQSLNHTVSTQGVPAWMSGPTPFEVSRSQQ